MKTVFIVPLMFTRDDLSKINTKLPEDYEAKSEEFWNYVEDKLKTPVSIQKLYFDSVTKTNLQQATEFIKKTNERASSILEKFRASGAEDQVTEDLILMQETASWARMLNDDSSEATQELLTQSIADREKFVAKSIVESLNEGEMALLFLTPGRRTSDYLSSEIRVIKIQPFDPSDYLNSWIVSLQLKK
jgi:hypothetical protein